MSKYPTRSNASFGSDQPADRTLTVSPEPPAAGRSHAAAIHHEVSQQTLGPGLGLGVNVEKANSATRRGSEDIYDATPRLDGFVAQGQGQGQGEGEGGDTRNEGGKGRGSADDGVDGGVGIGIAGGAVAAAGAAASDGAAAVTGDNMSFSDGTDDSELDENNNNNSNGNSNNAVAEGGYSGGDSKGEDNITPPKPTAPSTMNLEPEEKILVDLPVELAAVNDDDDDDGMPMMTATSYPGQEWNPYGAGEFGDWE